MYPKIDLKPAIVAGHGRKSFFPGAFRLLGPQSGLRDVYRLRYRAYRHAGWIDPSDEESLSDRFDRMPNTLCLAAYGEEGCIGAFRLTFDEGDVGARAMPCGEVFPGELARLKQRGHARIVELGRLAIEPEQPNHAFRSSLLVSIVRAAGVICYAADVDYAVIAVHKRFSRFQQSLFGFEKLGESATYNEIGEPTHFLGRAFSDIDAPHRRRNRFFTITDPEIEQARVAIDELGVGPAGTQSNAPAMPREPVA